MLDEAALIEALRDRRIAGAALDVFEREPLPVDHPLRAAPNTLLTPHVGYVTEEGCASSTPRRSRTSAPISPAPRNVYNPRGARQHRALGRRHPHRLGHAARVAGAYLLSPRWSGPGDAGVAGHMADCAGRAGRAPG
ncbi:MAG: NAD(P)-dependent oxidoreductase [Dehalococcoidia bacterium]